MDKYKVKVNPRAIRELDYIYEYIANEKSAPDTDFPAWYGWIYR